MKSIPALDAVRGYAVLMVAMYHFFIFQGGWIGVQVFFVLSGFLITASLLEAKERYRHCYFRRFYWRRALRIVPLYFAYLGVIGLVFLLAGVPREFREIWPYLFTYTSNFSRLGVFDRGGDFFVHFWSLGVEEQFYLTFPLAVFLLPRRALKHLLVLVIILAPFSRLVLGNIFAAQGFSAERIGRILSVLPITQLSAFGAGAALRVFDAPRWPRADRLAVAAVGVWLLAGAGMLIAVPSGRPGWSVDSLGHHQMETAYYYHVWGYPLTNLTSAAVVLAAAKGHFPVFFHNRVAGHVGKVSYGVYVLHLPLLHILRAAVPYSHSSVAGLFVFVGYFAAVTVLATASYRLFESRFLRLKGLVGDVPDAARSSLRWAAT